MKKTLLFALLLCLLLTACAARGSLAGTWVNRGQYEEGKDFVETMTLRDDGTAVIHLEYQGRDYQTVEGNWTETEGKLRFSFPDGSARDRVYDYTLDGDTLTFTGGGKTVTYQRQD